ncbi:MAG TPA: acetylxylan esterase [Opitutus sp.]|nr:acetylxylan esterase [Opitutus sp.]
MNTRNLLGAIAVGVALALPLGGQTTTTAKKSPPAAWPSPEERKRIAEASHADWQRMMAQLGLSVPDNLPREESDPKRPPNAQRNPNGNGWTDDGRFVVRSAWGNWIRYDLDHADVGPLPDPLTLENGEHVTAPAAWWSQRRPQIAELFAREIYGRIPADTPAVAWETIETDGHALDGRARLQRLVGRIDNRAYPEAEPTIELELYLPNAARGPVPVVVAISFNFPPGMRFPGAPTGPSALEQTIAQGWGYARFVPTSLQADNGAGLNSGIIGLMNRGQPRTPEQWGSIAAWSWGLSRIVDYLETNPAIDARRLAVQGHSRYGKTALVAAALEPRWALVFASCSGEGGAKLHRHDYGESVDIVASSGEYHWMAGNFLKYAGRWKELPIDQHELIALVAPRPVFITGGTQDTWADPVGMFRACVAAGPVYRLLGKEDLGRTEMPAPDEELIAGDLAFRYHEGGHFDVIDWPTFLKFADKYFGKTKS